MYGHLHATPVKLLLVWSVLLLLIENMSKQCMYLYIIYGDFVVYELLHMSCCHFIGQNEFWNVCLRNSLHYHNKR